MPTLIYTAEFDALFEISSLQTGETGVQFLNCDQKTVLNSVTIIFW